MTEKIEKNYIIVQTREDGEVALTKADTHEVTSRALKRYKAIDVPSIKLVNKREWMKSPSRKKRVRKNKSQKMIEAELAKMDAKDHLE